MTLVHAYTDLDKFKAALYRSNPSAQADSADNVGMERVIEGVSRAIDRIKNRRFYSTTADEVKLYTADNSHRCKILDDLLSLTTLKTDFDGDGVYETTWTAADYLMFPFQGGASERPWIEVQTRPFAVNYFPLYPGAVQITGKFGFSNSTPTYIEEACILGSIRVWGRPNKPYGFSGSAELGNLEIATSLRKDAEFMLLLDTCPTKVAT